MPSLGYTAYLRVYEPLAVFGEADRARWESSLGPDGPPSRAETLQAEVEESLHALVRGRHATRGDTPSAYFQVVDDLVYVCPWDLRLRVAEAIEDFCADLPDVITRLYVEPADASRVLDALDASRMADPAPVTHILSAAWTVPLHWFVLFEPSERSVGVDGERSVGMEGGVGGGGATLLLDTSMGHARRRLGRSLATLRRRYEESPLTRDLADLGRWLEEFHPYSKVQLDYAGLAVLLGGDALLTDRSVDDVVEALEALSAPARSGGSGQPPDEQAALAAYRRVVDRWEGLATLAGAS